jgi:hypothetical protein
MTLQTRYTELQSAGRVPLYCYKHAPVDPRKADNVQIALGLQPNGRYLNLADLDSHKAGQDAHAARAASRRRCRTLPVRSNGTTPHAACMACLKPASAYQPAGCMTGRATTLASCSAGSADRPDVPALL